MSLPLVIIGLFVVVILLALCGCNKVEKFSEVLGNLAPVRKDYAGCGRVCERADPRQTLGPPHNLRCHNACNDVFSKAVHDDTEGYGAHPHYIKGQQVCEKLVAKSRLSDKKRDVMVKNCDCLLEVAGHCKEQCNYSTDSNCLANCAKSMIVNCRNPGGWKRR